MSDLHFDPYQFAGRGALPASAASRIAFSDFGRMHTEQHLGNAPSVPPFALNDKQLQQVLILRAWRYIKAGNRREGWSRDKLNRAATAKALSGNSVDAHAPRIQHEMVKKHAAAVSRAGGYLQLHASIAFRSWRLGMNSVEVAESLGMTPQAVRQALWRMRAAAKELGFDAGTTRITTDAMKAKYERKSRA